MRGGRIPRLCPTPGYGDNKVVARRQAGHQLARPGGHYRIDALPPGTYSVEAYTDAPGDAGGVFGSPVPVQAGLTTPNIDIALQPPDATCLVVYQKHDAMVSFQSPGANDWWTKLTKLDGNWFSSTATTPAAGLSAVCSGHSHAGVAWGVFDSGGEVYGRQACATVNQLSASQGQVAGGRGLTAWSSLSEATKEGQSIMANFRRWIVPAIIGVVTGGLIVSLVGLLLTTRTLSQTKLGLTTAQHRLASDDAQLASATSTIASLQSQITFYKSRDHGTLVVACELRVESACAALGH